MTRIAFVTDIHVREAELARQIPLLERAAIVMARHKPDVILVGGDLAGLQVPHRCTPAERNALVDFFVRLSGYAPVLICRGNHDFPGDYDFLRYVPDIHWFTEPDFWSTTEPGKETLVLVLPWMDRSGFPAGSDYGAAVNAAYLTAAEKVAPRAVEINKRGGSVFILGHGAISGAFLREGQPPVPTADPMLDLAPIHRTLRTKMTFWGHYHAPQVLDSHVGKPISVYGGSLFINEFGEETNRGVTLWSPEKGIEHVPVSQRRKVRVGFDGITGEIREMAPDVGATSMVYLAELASIDSADFKIVVHADADSLAAAREHVTKAVARIQASQPDAKIVVTYDVERVTRVREGAEATVAAKTMHEKMDAYWSTLAPAPSPKTQGLAVELLTEIESGLDG